MADAPFIRIPRSLVDDGLLSRLSPSALKVYLAIASHADRRGLAWPSQSRLARQCGISRQHANRAVRQLRSIGLISHQPGQGIYCVMEMRQEPSAPQDTPCLRQVTPTRIMEPEPLNNNTNAGAVLEKEGFKPPDIRKLLAITDITPQRIAQAIANADLLASQGKLRNRGGYLRKAIENNYPPIAPAPALSSTGYRPEPLAAKKSREDRVEASRRTSQAERADAERLQKQIDEAIDAMSDERLAELKEKFLASLPEASRAALAEKSPRTSPILRGGIYAMLATAPYARHPQAPLLT